MSELQNTITEAVKTAMKARQMDQVKVLRNLQAAIKQVQIDGGKDLKDADILQILQKQVKQRNESLAIYQKNGRDDLAQKEQFEINVISNFFPTPYFNHCNRNRCKTGCVWHERYGSSHECRQRTNFRAG